MSSTAATASEPSWRESHGTQPAHSLGTRVAAAAAASAAAVVLVTPLDVVKVQMQASLNLSRSGATGLRHDLARAACIDARPSLCLSHLNGSTLNATANYLQHSSPAVSRAAQALTGTLCPTCSPHALSSLAVPWHVEPSSPGVLSTAANIVHKERVTALWRGLDTALVLSVPVVCIHIPLYDVLKAQLDGSLGVYSPAVAGMAARMVAVIATAPLELLRTRKQAATSSSTASTSTASGLTVAARRTPRRAGATSGGLNAAWARRAVAGLSGQWVGTSATLWRDVPFSGLYWMLAEPIRSTLLSRQAAPDSVVAYAAAGPASSAVNAMAGSSSLSSSSSAGADDMLPSTSERYEPAAPSVEQVLGANFLAGAGAGFLSAALTTPFDVIKTRLQTAGLPGYGGGTPVLPSYSRFAAGHLGVVRDSSTFGMAANIWRTQGVAGLFTGVGPRSARAALACGTVIAGYETIKMQLL